MGQEVEVALAHDGELDQVCLRDLPWAISETCVADECLDLDAKGAGGFFSAVVGSDVALDRSVPRSALMSAIMTLVFDAILEVSNQIVARVEAMLSVVVSPLRAALVQVRADIDALRSFGRDLADRIAELEAMFPSFAGFFSAGAGALGVVDTPRRPILGA